MSMTYYDELETWAGVMNQSAYFVHGATDYEAYFPLNKSRIVAVAVDQTRAGSSLMGRLRFASERVSESPSYVRAKKQSCRI